ncbi:MAG: hypothetical protein PVJ43_08240 [Gemmatimonadales bacterium]|jgi:predicted CXXCH cytochrome family protein
MSIATEGSYFGQTGGMKNPGSSDGLVEDAQMIRPRVGLLLAFLATSMFVPHREAQGQFVSPGKLSAPHAGLEGLLKCTRCHELKTPGASNAKCLECHEPLKARLAEGRGYHASVSERDCASCHEEHRGPATQIIELDTTSFDHTLTGFDLAATHAELPCRDCHQPDFITASDVRAYKEKHGSLDRTMLGLGTGCLTCHVRDDPHIDQFAGRSCDECHSEVSWKSAERFDHTETQYRLTGRHRHTECSDCHRTTRTRQGKLNVRFKPLEFSTCESCHEDEHQGRFDGSCTRCHSTSGWHSVRRSAVEDDFDHSNTEFPLAGKHADVECTICHAKRDTRQRLFRISITWATRRFAYPHPVADVCTSCHLDYHRNAFEAAPGGIACDNCHDEGGWTPGTYDFARHNRDAKFTLDGAHVATPCIQCHKPPAEGEEASQFRVAQADCESCHENDDPHQAQFTGRACDDCHDTRAFQIEEFDHASTRYELDGAHQYVPCGSCHLREVGVGGSTFARYKPLGTKCQDCHTGEVDRD